jgi:hypothetical protein
MSEQHQIEAVEKALGEPVTAELAENAWKVRTNLILASAIAVAVVFADLHIEPDSQVFGLKFRGLSDQLLTVVLLGMVGYLLVHFIWSYVDAFFEWRLRVTGTRLAFVTTGKFASEHGDYPSDPRQSTLYHWWCRELPKLGRIGSRLDAVDAALLKVTSEIQQASAANQENANLLVAVTPVLSGVQTELAALRRELGAVTAVVEAKRVPVSLKRFDRWFEIFLRSQNLRWLLIDCLAPTLLGAYAIVLLVGRS